MDKVIVKDLKCYAFHGCIEEERKAGGYYILTVEVIGNWSKASNSDQLEDAVDYVMLSNLALEEMKIPSNLIEHAANRIINKIEGVYPTLNSIQVTIDKLRAPTEQNAGSVSVSMQKQLGKQQ